jgi:hypothetical protein
VLSSFIPLLLGQLQERLQLTTQLTIHFSARNKGMEVTNLLYPAELGL